MAGPSSPAVVDDLEALPFPEVPEPEGVDTYGPDWLRSCKKPLSAEGERIARYVDWVFNGIYHEQRAVLRTDWNDTFVTLTISTHLATYDADLLTRIVVGAHDFCLRVAVEPATPTYLRLFISTREREGRLYFRHPTIEAALAAMRRLPAEQRP